MFTQNFLNYQKGVMMGKTYTVTLFDGGTLELSNGVGPAYSGIGYAMGMGQCRNPSKGSSAYNNMAGVFFGTGSTAPTKDDYTLEAVITSGLSIESSGALVGKESEGKYALWGSFVVKNTSSTIKNIYEIGIFSALQSGSNFSSVLMERTVLPEPISIQAGEQTIITHKITFNQTLSVD